MRITDIRCFIVEASPSPHRYRWRNGLMGSHDGIKPGHKQFTAMVRMETDEGIAGAVQIESSARYARSVMDLTERRLKSLIGENPLNTERLFHLIWEIDRVDEMHMTHLGLVDQLAWDIKSKKAGMPIWQMLGGNSPKVPAYASTVTWDTMDEYERSIKQCMDLGFR